MNFRVGNGRGVDAKGVAAQPYCVILMSVRRGAPYQDHWHNEGEHAGLLEYEGHDRARKVSEWLRNVVGDPKQVDQPLTLASGRPTDNGKFFAAAQAFVAGAAPAEVVQVYEKIINGVWSDRGRYELVDASAKSVPVTGRRHSSSSSTRTVLRFFLRPAATPDVSTPQEQLALSIGRQIPTAVKVAVFKRDQGRCVQCGATDNLHFDHDLPHSKGGSSLTEANVKLLCARHNLQKSDKIVTLGPLLGPLVAAFLAQALRGA